MNPSRVRPRATRPPTALVATLALVLACSNERSMPAAPAEEGGGRLRVANGAISTVSVSVDGTMHIASLTPSSLSIGIPISDGEHQVEFRALDGSALTARVTVSANAAGPVLVATTSAAGAVGGLAAIAVTDSGAVPAPGMTKLRVVHLAVNASPLDVWRTQPDYGTPIRVMFPFPYGSVSPYLQSTPGEWEVFATPEGNPVADALARLSLTTLANDVRTVVVFDAPGGGVRMEWLDDR